MRSAKNTYGFTLVEVLAAVAVTGILFVVLMTFMSNSLVSISVESARSDLLQDAQVGLDTIGRDIRLSASAEHNNRWQDNFAPSAPSNKLSWESNANTLILATSAMDSDNNVLFEDPLNYITYKNDSIFYVSNRTLYKRTIAAPIDDNAASTTCPKAHATNTCLADRILMNNVESFAVRYLSGDNTEVIPSNARSIELSVNLRAERYGKVLEAKYLTRMVFRNE